ncbi:MAG TPA: V-type ATPase subunit [Verrucomicrobiae bacterium]
MRHTPANDLDYLAARLHARRTRIAEGGRLEELCGYDKLLKLTRAVFPGAETATTADFQRRLVQQLAEEIHDCLPHLDGANHQFVEWLLTRLQIEDAKVLLRGILNHTAAERLRLHLVPLPDGWALAEAELLAAKTADEFAARLPEGSSRRRLQAILAGPHAAVSGFLLEAALDAGYFQELLARLDRIGSSERELLRPLVLQEVNLFRFLLAARGRFHFGLNTEAVPALRIAGAVAHWLKAVQSAPDVLSAARLAVGRVIDSLPLPGEESALNVPMVETAGWQRYLRLANRAFRCSHNGLAAVAGYLGMRRIEIANLTAVSEGIRLGAGKGERREHLLPPLHLEVANV